MSAKTESISLRLTPGDAAMLEMLAEEAACSRAAILTRALREFAGKNKSDKAESGKRRRRLQ